MQCIHDGFVTIGVAQGVGVHWVHMRPRVEKIIGGRNLQGKVVSAPPQAEEEIKFLRSVLLGGVIWRAELVTKKVNFSRKKCTPRENPGYACVCDMMYIST